jgi:cytochrome b
MSNRILVWDVPTRVFHWTMVLSFSVAYLTAESERTRDIHVAFGYILLGMLVFRLVWGFAGTHYARFKNFLYGPREVGSYVVSLIKRKPAHYVGHNPAGSVAIWLLLLFGLTGAVCGVLVYQEIGGDIQEEVHEMATDAMLAVVAIHVLGVLVSSIMHRENLVRSMITGYKKDSEHDGVQRVYGWLGVLMLVVAVTYWLISPAGIIK